MRLDDAPAVPHSVIDNRLTASAPLEDQLAALIAASRAQSPADDHGDPFNATDSSGAW
jgi:hypothetical protein